MNRAERYTEDLGNGYTLVTGPGGRYKLFRGDEPVFGVIRPLADAEEVRECMRYVALWDGRKRELEALQADAQREAKRVTNPVDRARYFAIAAAITPERRQAREMLEIAKRAAEGIGAGVRGEAVA